MTHYTHMQLRQTAETPLASLGTEHFTYRYAYVRAAETRQYDESGQDYLAFNYNHQSCLFVLCDGVSQSFYGEIAARLLGQALLAWLEHQTPSAWLIQNWLRYLLERRLRTVIGSISAQVDAQPINPDLPPLLHKVLLQKQRLGSHTTFVCGRIDLPRPDCPRGSLLLAWLGDSRLRLWNQHSESSSLLGPNFRTAQRWSSRSGSIGRPQLFWSPLIINGSWRFDRIVAYSDGLGALDQHTHMPDDDDLRQVIDRVSIASTSDDLSLLDLSLATNQQTNT